MALAPVDASTMADGEEKCQASFASQPLPCLERTGEKAVVEAIEPQVEEAKAEEVEAQTKHEGCKPVADGTDSTDTTSEAQLDANGPTEDASIEPEVQVANTDGQQSQMLEPTPADVGSVEGSETKAMPPKSSNTRRRATATKAPPLEAMAVKIKRLQAEAEQAEQAIEVEVQKMRELEAKIAAMRVDADAKRSAAHRASQEYIRKQCEASIAHLETCVPKRSPAPFFLFSKEVQVKGVAIIKQSKDISDKWNKLSNQEKQVYIDRCEQGNKRFREWSQSEEGERNLQERSELIKKCRAEGKEELDKALVDAAVTTPIKRHREAEATPEPLAKQRRLPPARTSPTTGLMLDEKVLEEANRAGLSAQLHNLAARPDVQALGKSSQELWDALKASNGRVNAAKHVLLSA